MTKQTINTPAGPQQVTKTVNKPAPQPDNDPKKICPQLILLDLDGDGIQITDACKSTQFVDAGGDGLLHRTAWAATGNGVLFFDPDGRNAITE
jgi:hypothetical protein